MPGMLVVPGTVSERTFVGERWDYGLRLSSGGADLRAAGPPEEDFATGSEVWIVIPESAIVLVEDAPMMEAAE